MTDIKKTGLNTGRYTSEDSEQNREQNREGQRLQHDGGASPVRKAAASREH